MKVYLLWHRTWNDNDEPITELDTIYHSKEAADKAREQCPQLYFVEEREVN